MTLEKDDWLVIAVVAGLLAFYLVGILTLRWIWHATGRRRTPVKYLLRSLLLLPVWLPLSLLALQAMTPSSIRLQTVFPEVPLAQITDLVSSHDVWSGGDLLIGFVATPDLVEAIVRDNGLKPYGDYPINGEKPDWWYRNACKTDGNPYSVGDLKLYAALDLQDRLGGWQNIMLAYCGRDGRVLIDARPPL